MASNGDTDVRGAAAADGGGCPGRRDQNRLSAHVGIAPHRNHEDAASCWFVRPDGQFQRESRDPGCAPGRGKDGVVR
jgi:hypothetical protein